MTSSIFRDGMPHQLLKPMYDDGFNAETGLVCPEFATELLDELKAHRMYNVGGALLGRNAGVHHEPTIEKHLDDMPLLAEYRNSLNDAITDVSGFPYNHLTYLTVRVCPVDEMSSNIHRNDDAAGPWLVALTVAGSGSINFYRDNVIGRGQEIALFDEGFDPEPFASSPMSAGDAWGIYSKEWSAPHAGGMNRSEEPKVIVLLYGWYAREMYPFKNQTPVSQVES